MRVFVCKCFTIFMTGGMIYYFLEISARHYSHYSMIICGGLATLLCGGLNQMFPKMGILAQMLVSSVIISELEFLTGYVVNIRLGLNVWDYSDMPFLWMFLSLIIIYVDDEIRCHMYNEERPEYRLI